MDILIVPWACCGIRCAIIGEKKYRDQTLYSYFNLD